MRPRTPLLFVLAAPLAVLSASANHLDERDTNAVHLAVLAFHPYPDPKGDAWGLPYKEGNRTGDWMSLRYGAYWFPTAVFDGVRILEQTPQGEGGGPFLETLGNYERHYRDRVLLDPAVTIRIEDGVATSTDVRANVTIASEALLDESALVLRAAVFQDDVEHDGGNGVANHRFVVRSVSSAHALPPPGPTPTNIQIDVPYERLQAGRGLGLAVWVQNEDEASRRFDEKEVLQVALWREGQDGPTVQANKAVLLELYTANWCEACPPADAAVDELANTFGLTSVRVSERGYEYLRPTAAWVLPVALALGLLAAAALRLQPRPPREEEGP